MRNPDYETAQRGVAPFAADSAAAAAASTAAAAPADSGLLAAVVEHHPDALLVHDPFADRVVTANAAASALLGYDRAELLQLRPSDLHRESLPGLIVLTQSVLEQGEDWTNELTCRTRDGRTLQIEYSARALSVDDRTLLLAVLRQPDELRHKRARASADDFVRQGLAEWIRVERLFEEIEQQNQLILRAAGEGIYGVNAEGNTTFVNPAAERMLGWKADDLVGRNMHAVVHHSHADGSTYPNDACPIFAAFRDGAVHRVRDEVFWRKDGSSFPVEYTSTPIRDGGRLIGAVVLFRDISDRKRAEAELRKAVAELQQLKQRLEMEKEYLLEEIREEHASHEIVGRSKATRQVIRQIELVGPTDATVLVSGESGTGKELIARAIHDNSTRQERPLIRVNCAAVPRDLFESEFFGHVKGAFSGAVRDRAGRFELAHNGTLFLDEVGEMPLELQGKLLRVLQEGQFERVGDSRTRSVNVRLIAATNRDLLAEVRAGRFREDLYFRLNVFPIQSVPLRERREDVPLLVSHCLAKACQRLGRDLPTLTRADVERLQSYDWPGNVRELQNVIERALIVSPGQALNLDMLPGTRPAAPGPTAPPRPDDGPTLTTEAERRRRDRATIVEALAACNGKVFGPGGAAELLGVKPTTLASRIKRMGISKP